MDLIAFNFWNKHNNCWCVCAVGGTVEFGMDRIAAKILEWF